ncbi:MAG: 2-dehydropantoate 2-reductase [Acidimicrobiia bacterium]|jgi:2-dehydropantoate 2-reductase
MSPIRSIAILGAGGIGCLLGASLRRQGAAVTLVARPRHVEAIAAGGLTVEEPSGEAWSADVVAVSEIAAVGEVDLTVLTSKSYDTASILDELSRDGLPSTRVVCAQNAVSNEAQAARLFPEVAAGVVRFGADMKAPGVVSARGARRFYLGSYPDGMTTWIEEFADLCREAGFEVETTEDVMAAKWHKLILNCESALSAVCDVRSDQMATDADALMLRRRLRDEAVQVLAAAGVRHLPVERVERVEPPAGHRPSYASTWYDLHLERHRVETPWINGEIIWRGIKAGIPTPVNSLLSLLCMEMSDEGRQPGHYSLQEVIDRLPETG